MRRTTSTSENRKTQPSPGVDQTVDADYKFKTRGEPRKNSQEVLAAEGFKKHKDLMPRAITGPLA